MNQELTIVLVNRALPYNCVGKLTGRSGVEYGHSIYEEGQGAHVCRLTLEQWRACKEDVTYGFTRRWSQWEVDVEAKDEEDGEREGKDEEDCSAEALAQIHNYRKLLALARRVGVANAEGLDTTAAVRAAILARVRGGEAGV